MNDAPTPLPHEATALSPDMAGTVRFLKVLTACLAGTMILGLIAIVALLVIRWPGPSSRPVLPDGISAGAVTVGQGWAAVVTPADELVIFDPATGEIRRRVPLAP